MEAKRNLLNIDSKGVLSFISQQELSAYKQKATEAFKTLTKGTGRGSEYLGWLNLPQTITATQLKDYNDIALEWKESTDVVIVIGIGGSYLGAKATLEALIHPFASEIGTGGWPKVVFAGQNLSEDYMAELMDLMSNKRVSTIVISKSGTTTEPAVAFRLIRKHIEGKYGKEEAAKRIVAVTDKSKGALKEVADKAGYRTFVIPDDVGGRYSVLTPVGLLPMAVAGLDIEKMIKGASDIREVCYLESDDNPAMNYAAIRNLLYSKGKKTEILVNFNPKLQYFAEWWKQLFGESEGKEELGIFPASVNFTSDLHSMGQYIQEGERFIFETVVDVRKPSRSVTINSDPVNSDGLNFLSGMSLEQINKMARSGTMLAHIDGGVPNILIEVEKLDEYNLGALFYFFEFACGVSAYILDINPFDQPGVEAYKQNMFALLGKPGFEELAAKLRDRL